MNSKRRRFFSIIAFLAFAMAPQLALSQDQQNKDDKRVALKGYDPVSYFTDNKPEQGAKEFSSEYDDTNYWFKSAEHRDMFTAAPEKYAPQYDGYCAIALSRGKKVEADPQAWAIKNGKLYVFFGTPGVPIFNKDNKAIIKKAQKNLAKIK